jgi:hypothetical protein
MIATFAYLVTMITSGSRQMSDRRLSKDERRVTAAGRLAGHTATIRAADGG